MYTRNYLRPYKKKTIQGYCPLPQKLNILNDLVYRDGNPKLQRVQLIQNFVQIPIKIVCVEMIHTTNDAIDQPSNHDHMKDCTRTDI